MYVVEKGRVRCRIAGRNVKHMLPAGPKSPCTCQELAVPASLEVAVGRSYHKKSP